MGKVSSNNRSIPKGKTQVNFNIDNFILERIKDLAFWENTTHSEIYNKSVVKFIELYEKRNGKIKARPVGKGLDNL